MKTQYSPEFRSTLTCVGLTPQDWRLLARRRHVFQGRRTHGIRQLVKKIQQVHTGKRRWLHGSLCGRQAAPRGCR